MTGEKNVTQAIDPVCGMSVDPETAKHLLDHGNLTYYFCAARCKDKFQGDPKRYLASKQAAVVDGPAVDLTAGKATDPVCGMAVDSPMAKQVFDYQGSTYYFCGPGCKTKFSENPEKPGQHILFLWPGLQDEIQRKPGELFAGWAPGSWLSNYR